LSSYLLLEDGVSHLLFEDGSGALLLDFPVPVVTPASFTIIDALNAPIGTVTATNAPTSFAIVSGNAAGYFAIDNSGNLSTTAIAAPATTSLTPSA